MVADLTDVSAMARALIDNHLGAAGWDFRFDYARLRGGMCDHNKRIISLSRHLCTLWTLEQAEQVMLHEIAHALVGPRHKHNTTWLRTARSLGYTGGVTHSFEVAEHLAPWRGTCPAGHIIVRFRQPPKRLVSCSRCSRTYSPEHRINWEWVG